MSHFNEGVPTVHTGLYVLACLPICWQHPSLFANVVVACVPILRVKLVCGPNELASCSLRNRVIVNTKSRIVNTDSRMVNTSDLSGSGRCVL